MDMIVTEDPLLTEEDDGLLVGVLISCVDVQTPVCDIDMDVIVLEEGYHGMMDKGKVGSCTYMYKRDNDG